ncbi:MAG: hypothetical protein HYT10_02840 [Candidatus Levybacteria bacterium]|nr:hypothetical protein [Candidatus Levybacteria bacterium]
MSVEYGSIPGVVNGARETREHSRNGIKFFAGSALPDKETYLPLVRSVQPGELREASEMERRVWRPEETLDAAELFFNVGRINVVGNPQWGKGTILYGLSEVCHRFGWGYLFIDGHHQEAPTEEVIAAIDKAQERGYPIFYDAFDHNFGDARQTAGGIRMLSKEKQEERTTAIMEALDATTVPVAITNHDDTYAELFIDHILREKLQPFLDKYPLYELPAYLQSEESITVFLEDHGVPASQVDTLLHMEDDPEVVTLLVNTYGDKAFVDRIFTAVRSFSVLKEMVKPWDDENFVKAGRREEVLPLLEIIESTRDPKAILQLAHIIREADMKDAFLSLLRRSAKTDRKAMKAKPQRKEVVLFKETKNDILQS